MDTILPDMGFVNEQVAFHQKKARQFADVKGKEWRQKLHIATAVKFQKLAEDVAGLLEERDRLRGELDVARSGAAARPANGGPLQLNLTLDEVQGLPEELIKELSISDSDRTDFMITSLIQEAGGILTLDRLIVALYRKTGEVYKRQALTNRLYRMGQKGLVYGVPGRKGLYATHELTAEEVSALG